MCFLKGKENDCPLSAHELIRNFRGKKQAAKGCHLKIDLHKAFDSINREFVYYSMHCMSFTRKWITWIKECFPTDSLTVMINGAPAGYSREEYRNQAGWPNTISISLYICVGDGILVECVRIGHCIKGNFTCQKRVVTNLLFVDDKLVFGKANKSFNNMSILLENLELHTSLPINKEKSKLFFSKGCLKKERKILDDSKESYVSDTWVSPLC